MLCCASSSQRPQLGTEAGAHLVKRESWVAETPRKPAEDILASRAVLPAVVHTQTNQAAPDVTVPVSALCCDGCKSSMECDAAIA